MEEARIPHIHNLDIVRFETLDENILRLEIAVDDVHLVQLIQSHEHHFCCLFEYWDREELGMVLVNSQKVLAEELCLNEEVLLVVEAGVKLKQILLISVAVGVYQL